FALTLVDGSVRHGALDTKGVARLERLEAGLCTVTFPRIDAREHGFRGALPPQSEEGDGIKTYHRARDTEWTGHIAQAHRFRDYNTVWLHPANQAIRARRVPEMLRAGDVIAVPAFTTRSFDVVTGQRHDFEVRVGT